MKVFQFMVVPPPFGGVTVYVKRLVKYLDKMGFGVGCLYMNKHARTSLPLSVNVYKAPKHLNSIWAIFSLPRIFWIVRKYDVIHTHNSLNISFTLWMLKRFLNIPIVFTIHNQMIRRECASMNYLDRYFFRKLKNDKFVQFITVNSVAADILQSEFGEFKNTIIIKPAFIQPIEEGKASDYLSESLLAFLNKDKGPIILFYAESFAMCENREIYGPSTLIMVFNSLKKIYSNLRLLFCMPNPDFEKILNLKSKLDNKEYEDDIYWQLSPLSEMWPVIKNTSVLFRPTCTDGDAVMIREALMYGLPVIASDAAKRPEGCLVYPYDSIETAVQMLNNLLSNPHKKPTATRDYAADLVDIYSGLIS